MLCDPSTAKPLALTPPSSYTSSSFSSATSSSSSSPSAPSFSLVDPCGSRHDDSYCSMTLIALCIVSISALLTLLAASGMYTGLPCHPPFGEGAAAQLRPTHDKLPSKLHWDRMARIDITENDITVLRMNSSDRCYVMANTRDKASSGGNFIVVRRPLSEELTAHFAGERGLAACRGKHVYIVREAATLPAPPKTTAAPTPMEASTTAPTARARRLAPTPSATAEANSAAASSDSDDVTVESTTSPSASCGCKEAALREARCQQMLLVCPSGEVGEYDSCYEWTEDDYKVLRFCQ